MKMLKTLPFFLILFIALPSKAQIYLQIEKFGDPVSIKFQPGDYIKIKTEAQPDRWVEKRILQILPEENVIFLDDDVITPDFIRQIRVDKPEVKQLGTLVMQFGIAWFFFAGILEVTNRYDFGTDTAVVGGLALGLGFGIRNGLSKKDYKMGKNARLRIVDVRFSIDSPSNRLKN